MLAALAAPVCPPGLEWWFAFGLGVVGGLGGVFVNELAPHNQGMRAHVAKKLGDIVWSITIVLMPLFGGLAASANNYDQPITYWSALVWGFGFPWFLQKLSQAAANKTTVGGIDLEDSAI